MLDLSEDGTEYLIKTELPGGKKRDVKVTTEFKDGVLCVYLTKNRKANRQHLEANASVAPS